MSENNGGDVLARGGVRATFRTAGSSVTKEQWDRIWRNDEEPTSRDTDAQKTGDAGANAGASVPDATGF